MHSTYTLRQSKLHVSFHYLRIFLSNFQLYYFWSKRWNSQLTYFSYILKCLTYFSTSEIDSRQCPEFWEKKSSPFILQKYHYTFVHFEVLYFSEVLHNTYTLIFHYLRVPLSRFQLISFRNGQLSYFYLIQDTQSDIENDFHLFNKKYYCTFTFS